MLIHFDYDIFQMINHLAASASVLNPLMKFLAEDAEYLFFAGVLIYWFLRTDRNRRMTFEALIAACIGLGISGLIGHFLYRDRPFAAHTVIQLIAHPANASFPSDHALGAFVIASTFWLYRWKEGILWLILGGLIALSRVWTGVHYPSDVIAGAVIGNLVALTVHGVFKHSARLRTIETTIIRLYERIEHKIWARKPHVKSSK
ncbi:undecaprenyl-diphosphatase [Paenibacillus zeisoli]|uniref:Undecaprenyl-diphosphatase n=1 Tax=Paenibacillus zeisoli TaxID=2496267 RepID=A0A3S1JNN9_9BACL|nr:undecaprenyl-diphosphatase [Paenibacillus zeisoli]RUT31594.1 undecaprenyl-diphosphatase [Paenibacillus zeisoli]